MDLPKTEQQILKFWKNKSIFKKTLEKRKKGPRFVFYEGPPFANGKPGIHHLLSRSFKDAILRYKTMKGFYAERKAGWDTHGLPTEMETEKKLGVKSKKEIEKIGIKKFTEECEKNIFTYKEDWENFTTRIGYWLDIDNPYITCSPEYIESVWWTLKQIWEKGFLYEDYKVIPYCPRCGTSLSFHEVAQGYKKVKEPAIYVKLKLKTKVAKFKNTSLLIWTTTPWTLPANVAVAINPNFVYLKVKIDGEYLILAEGRLEDCEVDGEVVERIKGKDLIGLEYNPLFDIKSATKEKNIYKVIEADFVSLEEGTGLVHVAPAFGEDDMRIGKENDLPILMTVDKEGKIKKEIKEYAGMFVKKADPLIVEELEGRNLIFRTEEYTHDYPFCWRCDTPLLYYSKKSWFIDMQKVKKDLIKNNQEINWMPAHLKNGRFGEWLRDVKDWNLTRERYWGTPLPVWKCQKCEKVEVIGSINDLTSKEFSTNNYFLMRHGHSVRQENKKISCWPETWHCPLTQKGKTETSSLAEKIGKEKIDLIFSSDLLRTKQTAEIVSEETGIKVKYDPRLREINFGVYNGELSEKYDKNFPKCERFNRKAENGESWSDTKMKILDFVKELEEKYKNKNILIISHGGPLAFLQATAKGLSNKEILESFPEIVPSNNEFRKFEFKNLPYDEKGNLNFHRPYIDKVKFSCSECDGLMERASEVIDCWFDSGSMPYAQLHYPFENKNLIDEKKSFPADFICEGVDQTRGWFYTLLAISTLLGLGISYKNVISHGIVLDEKGNKMSKSKGNIVKPNEVADKFGVDCARLYFYTVNSVGEPKRFDFKDIQDVSRRFFNTIWNSFNFLSLYGVEKEINENINPKTLLDKWIVSKLESLKLRVNKDLELYDIVSAARLFEGFVDDLSNWYIRRSRRRFQKSKNETDKEEASQILSYIFLELAKLLAPFTPFFAEDIYQRLPNYKDKQESVHLCDYPEPKEKLINEKLEQNMEEVRKIVALTLNQRADLGIKVRQPLSSLKIKRKIIASGGQMELDELSDLIKQEVNVKEVSFGDKIKKEIELDVVITPALEKEGMIREIVRQIQVMRKKAGYKPKHKILVRYFGNVELNNLLAENEKAILEETKAEQFEVGERPKLKFDIEKRVKVNQGELWLAIKKI